MNSVFPTPTEYQTDPEKMADTLFGTSLLSKESQTAIFYGNIKSLDAVMKRFIHQDNQLKNEVVTLYTELFERYFDQAEVIGEVIEDPHYGNARILKLHIRYMQEKVWRNFSETVIFLNGKTKKLTEVING